MTPRNNWQVAHLRMLETLPKRTHSRRIEEAPRGGRERIAVRVDGVSYPSMSHAAKALRTSRLRISNMVRRGEADLE